MYSTYHLTIFQSVLLFQLFLLFSGSLGVDRIWIISIYMIMELIAILSFFVVTFRKARYGKPRWIDMYGMIVFDYMFISSIVLMLKLLDYRTMDVVHIFLAMGVNVFGVLTLLIIYKQYKNDKNTKETNRIIADQMEMIKKGQGIKKRK